MSAPTGDDAAAQQLLANARQTGTDNPTGPDTGQDTDWKAEADKWKHLAQKHEQLWQTAEKTKPDAVKVAAELKELRRKATEYDKYQESQKTAEQRLNDQLAAAQVELAQHRTREVRTTAALQAGLPADMAEYITEVEPDAALEQAKRLAEHLKPEDPARARVPDARQGAVGTPARQGDDPNAWIRRLAGRA